ncbi:MAG TPA: lamin tail domain-containing protein [Baekduia sp.]
MHVRRLLLACVVLLAAATIAPAANATIINEVHLRGASGAQDEYVELYNDSDHPVTVATTDASSGWALVASDGATRFVVPNGTVIPARGHFLGANSAGYSFTGQAAPDATWTTDIPDNAGVALFDTSNPAHFTLAHRLDAVGSSSEPNTLFKTGTGYPALTPFSINYALSRDLRPGLPKNTQSNAADFVFVDTNGTSAGAGQRLGAPSPEDLASTRVARGDIAVQAFDPSASLNVAPNQARDLLSAPSSNATFGRVTFRRRLVNLTGSPITALNLRIADLTTFPSPSGVADLRPQTSSDQLVLAADGNHTVRGTTLVEPPAQPNGGGINSLLQVGAVTGATPLPPHGAIDISVQMGIQQTGAMRFCAQIGATPGANGLLDVTGVTDTGMAPVSQCSAPFAPVTPFSVPPTTFADVPMGSVGAPTAITIANPGSGELPVGGVVAGGDFVIESDGCTGTTVPSGGSCSVSVSFAPSATGPRGGTLDVSSPLVSTSTGALGGTGIAPAAGPTAPTAPTTPNTAPKAPTALKCTIKAATAQTRLSRGRLDATIMCTRGARATLSGKVTIAHKVLKLGGVTKQLTAGKPAKVALTLPSKTRAKVLAALKHKRKVPVALALAAKDANGAKATAKATIAKLRRT